MSSTTGPLSGRRDDGGTRAVSSSHSQKAFRVHEWRQSRKGVPSSHRDGPPRGGLRNRKRLRLNCSHPRFSASCNSSKDSRALIFRSPAWGLTFARNRQQYAVTRTRRSIVPYRDGSMIAKETGLLQAGAKRDDPFPLRGHETSLLRRERHSQARPLLNRFLQPGRTIPPEFGLTECVQGAAAAVLISRIVCCGTMPPELRLRIS
ncbi:hypothetical protein T07_13056 [Trichinella nelsoni]|uniref:Uncharacterized protein n=1 Tax=Trichinella nelsoni TaxID=6336 RepID=A0A0V0RDF8_9BILA|nr:hypothetical protein T07_13056 [Trichinella nelsoni]